MNSFCRLGFALLVGFSVSSATAHAADQSDLPRVLIFQRTGGVGITISGDIAQGLDGTGKVRSIVYGLEDPIFRAAALDGKLGETPKKPNLEEVKRIARALDADYIVILDVADKSGTLTGTGKMLRGGSEIWSNSSTMAIKTGGINDTSASLSNVARALVSSINEGPFAKLPKSGLPGVILPAEGQAPNPGEATVPSELFKLDEVLRRADAALIAGDLRAAMLLFRDAIDVAPLEIEPRRRLIQIYIKMGQPDMALEFAAASARALGSPEMLMESSKVLIQAGKYDQARATLNDAMMLDPGKAEVRLLLAELAMCEAKPETALEHLEAVLKAKPTAEAHLLRALCRTLLGSESGAKLDLDRAKKLDPKILDASYDRMMETLDAAMRTEGETLRVLMQKAAVRRTADEVVEGVESQERLSKASLTFVSEFSPKEFTSKSHELRLLALKLLRQTVAELKAYVGTGQEDNLTDSRFSLGEMLSQMAQLATAYKAERTKDAGISQTSGGLFPRRNP